MKLKYQTVQDEKIRVSGTALELADFATACGETIIRACRQFAYLSGGGWIRRNRSGDCLLTMDRRTANAELSRRFPAEYFPLPGV